MSDLERLSPPEFCRFLASQGIRRFFLIPDESSGGVRASHAALEPLARFVGNDERDFDLHEGVFMQVAPETGVLQGAFVHRTCRGQGAGGLRFWRYDTMEGLLRDGLRLARGMTYKSALAGLWWGGGKGVMAEGTGRDPGSGEVRRRIYEEYGEFVTSLKGCYVTAEDVGTSVGDMAAVFSRTRFTSCIPGSLGGSGNPSVPTARGIVHGMEAALEHLGQGGLAGKSVAIQGLGHVGEPLVAFLRDKGVSRIVGSDIDPSREEAIRRGFPDLDVDVRIVARGDCSIFSESVDILSPCATGAVLRPDTIPTIAARVVCGAANNQLQDPLSDDLLLQENGILYMPDFLVNRMGIVTCADEAFGYVDPDPAIERHLGDDWEDSIYNLSLRVLKEAEASGSTPARVALELAEVRSLVHHPIWGHRGAQIIGSLARGDWAA